MAFESKRLLLLSVCLACSWVGASGNLKVVKQWSELTFAFPSDADRQSAVGRGFHVPGSPGNSVPIDVDVYYSKGKEPRIFVTNPRFDDGRPITLGTVDAQGLIHAYPDYSWHNNQGKNCNGFTSVFRVAIDECNRLWVTDTGKIGNQQFCPPKLLAFDLTTDKVVFSHIFDKSMYTDTSLFVNTIVDIRPTKPGDCSDTFVYIADCTGFGLVVVDVAKNKSWRLSHNYAYPFPSRGTFTIEGESFDLMDGFMGMALSPLSFGSDRLLFWHALASTSESAVRTSIIRNSTFLTDVTTFPEERPNQAVAEAMDRDGVLYFGIMDPPSILCWNINTEYSPRNFHQLAIDRDTMQFASGVKVVTNLDGEQELWILHSSFQKYMAGSINTNRINFRIHTEKISNLLANIPGCRLPKAA